MLGDDNCLSHRTPLCLLVSLSVGCCFAEHASSSSYTQLIWHPHNNTGCVAVRERSTLLMTCSLSHSLSHSRSVTLSLSICLSLTHSLTLYLSLARPLVAYDLSPLLVSHGLFVEKSPDKNVDWRSLRM